MIKRIMKFQKHDWIHILTLFKSGVINLIKMDFIEAKDSFYWIKVHLSYDSEFIKNNNND